MAMSGKLLTNVSVKDATKVIVHGRTANLEGKQLDVTLNNGEASQFKKGAFYTATDGHTSWKVAFKSGESRYAHFLVM
jgi:hypothetical protein